MTWDQGTELARHKDITLATDLAIYFCDPHKPWQRGSNENTDGLLRQYFPRSTDLTVHTPARLLDVATELNGRPRKPSATAPRQKHSSSYSRTRNDRLLRRPPETTIPYRTHRKWPDGRSSATVASSDCPTGRWSRQVRPARPVEPSLSTWVTRVDQPFRGTLFLCTGKR